MLSEEQIKSIKIQLFKGLEKVPKEQADAIIKQVNSMNNVQLEEFLIQNKLISSEGPKEGQTTKKSNPCVYCSLAEKQIESFAIYEDKDYLAALEINPFSEGHIILIPKKHLKSTKSISSKAFTLANRIGKHLVKQLKASSFQINSEAPMNHALINIIPIYKTPLTYERKPSKKEELQKLAIKIGELKRITHKPKQEKQEKTLINQIALPKLTRFP